MQIECAQKHRVHADEATCYVDSSANRLCLTKHRMHMQPSDDERESELEREDRSVLHSGKEWCARRVSEVSEGGWSVWMRVWMNGTTPHRMLRSTEQMQAMMVSGDGKWSVLTSTG